MNRNGAMTKRIIKAYLGASQYHKDFSTAWYWKAREDCEDIAIEFKLPLVTVVGVLSALSPGCPWERNLLDAYAICALKFEHECTTYPNNVQKAKEIRMFCVNEYAVLHRLKPNKESGDKIYAFYHNIMYPWKREHVTIDRHALAIMFGRIVNAKERKLTSRAYRDMVKVWKAAAKRLNMVPSALQAATWCAWTGREGDIK